MDYSHFTAAAPGRLVPTILGERAFLPDPLPPRLSKDEIAFPLARAAAALAELKGACRRLANPYILIRPLQRSEALTSSAMEGTFTTSDELLLADMGLQPHPTDQTREVTNYIRALSWAFSEVGEGPVADRTITNRTLREAHRILLADLSSDCGANKRPGEFKREQNQIGGTKHADPVRAIRSARFIPPPPGMTLDCMSQLERFINDPPRPDRHPMIDMALAHYQFETIHPFADGNGRVGRMLISLMAVKDGMIDQPALYLSPVIEARKDEYIRLMYETSTQGAWAPWLLFFLELVERSAQATVATVDRLIRLQDELRHRAGEAVKSHNAARLIDHLFAVPVVTALDVATHLSITDVGARKLLNRMAEEGIVEEFRGVYPRAYIARGIVEASTPG